MIENLVDYTLVILDYEAFIERPDLQQYFVKNMTKALDMGVNFCFVYYDNVIPSPAEASPELGAGQSAYRSQIGHQVLWDLKILPHRAKTAFHDGKAIRNEFKPFLDRWGTTYIYFQPEQIKTVIYQAYHENNIVLGFADESKKGKIIFLPFLRDMVRNVDLIQGIQTLVDCLLTYITKSLVNIPSWAEQVSFFNDEQALIDQQSNLLKSLEKVRDKLSTFKEAKALLFQHEYTLESTVPRFLKDKLSINTVRDERHKEDFWITDGEGNRLAIAEVKSVVKGFRRGLIHYVLSHREGYGLEEDFPALLFVNCNLQAGSWEDKDRIIDITDCQYAAQNNVLIIRVEDVVRMWAAKRTGKLKGDQILTLLLNSKGWLHVTKDLKVEVKPKETQKGRP